MSAHNTPFLGDNKGIEILAPVGGPEQLIAAIRSGANAVYLGAKGFNARANAKNFDDLREVVSYAHQRGVKVHITLNTLIMDAERDALIRQIEQIAASGADAVIVQDLGVAALVRQCCASLPLHASTQMSVHSPAGVKTLSQLGFTRVVLARELTQKEIKEIVDSTDMEVEVFVHGALCMSVSGQCYLSSMIGGRSGNRGQCAQPCRLAFTCEGRDHALSLKDLSLYPLMETLKGTGVRSLKIEGRMKRPEYVAAAVAECKKALMGQAPDMDKLSSVFSRSGFTNGYFTGKRDASMFGYRTKEDVVKASGVLGEIAGAYRLEAPLVGVDMVFCADEKGSSLHVSDGERQARVTGPIPDKALKKPLTLSLCERNLNKTGGTPFFLRSLKGDVAKGISLKASAVNAMRKEGLARLLEKRGEVAPHPFIAPKPLPPIKNGEAAPVFYLKTDRPDSVYSDKRPAPDRNIVLRVRSLSQLSALDEGTIQKAENFIVPLNELYRCFSGEEKGKGFYTLSNAGTNKIVAELDALIFGGEEEKTVSRLIFLKEKGIKRVATGSLAGIELAKSAGISDIIGDFGLNLLNTQAVIEAAKLGVKEATLSFEGSVKALSSIKAPLKKGIIAYGYLPLMLLRACPAKGERGCVSCTGQRALTDRLGQTFTLLCEGKRYQRLYNTVPLHLADKMKEISGFDFYTLYFTKETPTTVRRVVNEYFTGSRAEGKKTGGLYFRKLL